MVDSLRFYFLYIEQPYINGIWLVVILLIIIWVSKTSFIDTLVLLVYLAIFWRNLENKACVYKAIAYSYRQLPFIARASCQLRSKQVEIGMTRQHYCAHLFNFIVGKVFNKIIYFKTLWGTSDAFDLVDPFDPLEIIYKPNWSSLSTWIGIYVTYTRKPSHFVNN